MEEKTKIYDNPTAKIAVGFFVGHAQSTEWIVHAK